MDLEPFTISRPEGTVVMVLQAVIEDDGNKVCGIRQVVGSIPAPPKAWVAAVREEVAKVEGLARDAGFDEIRICGRDWSRVLDSYEFIPGLPNGIRKRLR